MTEKQDKTKKGEVQASPLQPELPLENEVVVDEVPQDEVEAVNEALELTGGGDKEAFQRKREQLIAYYGDKNQAKSSGLNLLHDVGVLDILKGHAKAYELVSALRNHWDTEALIPAVLYSMETPHVFRLARKGPGGQILSYVPGDYSKMMLNTFFPGWSFENVTYERAEFDGKLVEIICHGQLVIRYANGKEQRISTTGRNPVHYTKFDNKETGFVSLGNAYKGAETDCLKKAAASLGIGWDVYYGLYSEKARTARKLARDKQAEQEEGQAPKRKPQPEKILLDLKKSFKLAKKEEPVDQMKAFWAKGFEILEIDKEAKGLKGTKAEIHNAKRDIIKVRGTVWLASKFVPKGMRLESTDKLISIKDLSFEQLQHVLIGVAVSVFHPDMWPKEK